MKKRISTSEAAISMRLAGLNAAPCTENKAPNLDAWTSYQSRTIPEEILALKFAENRTKGVGVICGKISGNFEVIDIDTKYDLTGTLYQDICNEIKDINPELFEKLTRGRSRTGGAHFYYRCDYIEGNKKLAYRASTEKEKEAWRKDNKKPSPKVCLIETRGEGGFIVTYPTEGYSIESGDICEVPHITKAERDIIFRVCKGFNTYFELQEKSPSLSRDYTDDSESPFDAYNESGDILRELSANSWTVKPVNGKYHLRANPRKGAPHGTYRDGVLYFFSGNVGFTAERGYSGVQAYAYLNGYGDKHAGARIDWGALAVELANKGFGKLRKVEKNAPQIPHLAPKVEKEQEKDPLEDLIENLRLKKEAEEILASLTQEHEDLYKNTPFIGNDVYSTLPMFFQRLLDGLEGRIRDMAFIYLIGLVSGCFDNLKVRHGGDQVPVLFTYVIAPPSSGKNICTKMHRVILGLHNKRKAEYESDKADWEARKNLAKSQRPPQPFDEPAPVEKKLWQTANMSAAAFSQALMNNNLVISDSEGNTLANCLKQEWGGDD